ncbi:MAG: ABC transporter permease [Phycisphaerales bacterium]
MALTDFTIIRRSMFTRLFSTITTVATVAVAVALMLVLLSMRDSGQQAFERGAGNAHLLVSRDGSAMESILNGLYYAKPPQAPITWKEYEQFASRFPFEWAVPMQQGDSYRGYPTLATTPEFFSAFRPATDQPWELASGEYFTKEFEVVVGSVAAKGAGIRLNDRLVLTHGAGATTASVGGGAGAAPAPHVHDEFKMKVVGILKATGTSHDRAIFMNLNTSWILHAFDRRERAEIAEGTAHAHDEHEHDHDEPPMSAGDLTDEDRLITGILVRVAARPGKDATALLPSVFDTLRRDKSITVAAPSDQVRKLFQIVGGINQILIAIAAAVVVSSGIAIMLALYNSMEQRRRQVAILRVLGCSQSRVFGLVLTESALIGVLGVLAGALLSVLAGFVIAEMLRARIGMVVQPAYALEWVLPVCIGTIALACLAGLAPAMMAYRTSVATHLKPVT